MGRCWVLHPTSGASYLTKQPVGSKRVGPPPSESGCPSWGVSIINERQPWEVAMETPILQVREPGWERGSLGEEVTESGLDISCDPNCLHLPRPRALTVTGRGQNPPVL